MVPLIRRIVLNVRARDRLAARKRRELAALSGEQEKRTTLKADLRYLSENLERYASELEALGCILRDRTLGLIDAESKTAADAQVERGIASGEQRHRDTCP